MNSGVWEYRRKKGRLNVVLYRCVYFRGMKRNTTNIREESKFCIVAKTGYHASVLLQCKPAG
jgi:hypothetical protein